MSTKISPFLHIELDLSGDPVTELCTVIAHVLRAYPGQERTILTRLRGEIDDHLNKLDKEVDRRGNNSNAQSDRRN
jgi:hypothetical protein